jgi:hypothetical protein
MTQFQLVKTLVANYLYVHFEGKYKEFSNEIRICTGLNEMLFTFNMYGYDQEDALNVITHVLNQHKVQP